MEILELLRFAFSLKGYLEFDEYFANLCALIKSTRQMPLHNLVNFPFGMDDLNRFARMMVCRSRKIIRIMSNQRTPFPMRYRGL